MRYTTAALAFFLLLATDGRGEDPKELVSLKESWLRARQQATTPLDRKYLDALNTLKTRFTKEGKLEAAIAVDSQIKELTTSLDAKPEQKSSNPWFIGGFWPYHPTHTMEFKKRGVMNLWVSGALHSVQTWEQIDENTVIVYDGTKRPTDGKYRTCVRVSDTEMKVTPDGTTAVKREKP